MERAPTLTKLGRNAPCPCGSGKKYKQCCMGNAVEPVSPTSSDLGIGSELVALDAADSPLDGAFDRRVVERASAQMGQLLKNQDFETYEEANAFLADVMANGQPPAWQPQTPLERAQDRMYDAFEAKGRRRISLAREALEISPDCADAYVLLAEETAKNPKQALALYEQGVAAGERAVGPDAFVEWEGEFWGNLDLRPYMRARLGLAYTLAELERHEEAVAHAQELLRLNSDDNQGVRYFLLRELLLTDDDAAVDALLRTYPEESSAQWSYTAALVKFRALGDHVFARRAFAGAIVANPFVPPYLSGAKRLPRKQPDFYGMGDEHEAQWYVAEQRRAWQETPGALAWLRQLLAEVEHAEYDAIHLISPDELDPAGPSFFLNPYDNWRHTRCPKCDEKTRPRRRNVVILIDPDVLWLTGTECRYCPSCDLLIAHADNLQRSMVHQVSPSIPDIVGTDYVVLGVIATSDVQDKLYGQIDLAWATERLKRFRAYEQFTDPWEDDLLAHVEELSAYLPPGPELVRATR